MVPVSEHLIVLSVEGFTLVIDLLANILGGNPLVLLVAADSKFYWICEQFSSLFKLLIVLYKEEPNSEAKNKC